MNQAHKRDSLYMSLEQWNVIWILGFFNDFWHFFTTIWTTFKSHNNKVAPYLKTSSLYLKVLYKGIFLTLYLLHVCCLLCYKWSFVISGFVISRFECILMFWTRHYRALCHNKWRHTYFSSRVCYCDRTLSSFLCRTEKNNKILLLVLACFTPSVENLEYFYVASWHDRNKFDTFHNKGLQQYFH